MPLLIGNDTTEGIAPIPGRLDGDLAHGRKALQFRLTRERDFLLLPGNQTVQNMTRGIQADGNPLCLDHVGFRRRGVGKTTAPYHHES